jgi:hypothetical protein
VCACVCVSCTTPYVYVYDRQPPEAEMSERRGGGVLLVVKMPHGGWNPEMTFPNPVIVLVLLLLPEKSSFW